MHAALVVSFRAALADPVRAAEVRRAAAAHGNLRAVFSAEEVDEFAALVRAAPDRWTVCPGCFARIERTGVLTLRRPGRETRRWLVRVRRRVGASLVLPAKSTMRSSTRNVLRAIIPPCCASRPWLGRADAPSSQAATHGSSTARRFMGGSPPRRLGSGIKSTAALEDGGGCARCGPAGAGRPRPALATSVGREPRATTEKRPAKSELSLEDAT